MYVQTYARRRRNPKLRICFLAIMVEFGNKNKNKIKQKFVPPVARNSVYLTILQRSCKVYSPEKIKKPSFGRRCGQ